MTDFLDWLAARSSPEWLVYVKRLSANDTGATKGHQAGLYVPRSVIEPLFPSLTSTKTLNPDHFLEAHIVSHCPTPKDVRAVYYNNRFHPGAGSRDEHRITRWGGRSCPLQDENNTGAAAIFAFRASSASNNCDYLEVWVCRSLEEEEQLEALTGEVLPDHPRFAAGDELFGGLAFGDLAAPAGDRDLPDPWKAAFPSGAEIIQHLSGIVTFSATDPDKLLLERRDKEYALFRKLEEVHVLDRIKKGFASVDEFMKLANAVSNRRKARSGRSLELHLEFIFRQEGLTTFDSQCVTEHNKRPDFIFPSCAAYRDPHFPEGKLRMLAVKTTCKDRWRQILDEANRIRIVHLFTIQEGVSVTQFRQMTERGVRLVVPKPLHPKYPKEIRGELMSLEKFIKETKASAAR
jgi:hypothetical protein